MTASPQPDPKRRNQPDSEEASPGPEFEGREATRIFGERLLQSVDHARDFLLGDASSFTRFNGSLRGMDQSQRAVIFGHTLDFLTSLTPPHPEGLAQAALKLANMARHYVDNEGVDYYYRIEKIADASDDITSLREAMIERADIAFDVEDVGTTVELCRNALMLDRNNRSEELFALLKAATLLGECGLCNSDETIISEGANTAKDLIKQHWPVVDKLLTNAAPEQSANLKTVIKAYVMRIDAFNDEGCFEKAASTCAFLLRKLSRTPLHMAECYATVLVEQAESIIGQAQHDVRQGIGPEATGKLFSEANEILQSAGEIPTEYGEAWTDKILHGSILLNRGSVAIEFGEFHEAQISLLAASEILSRAEMGGEDCKLLIESVAEYLAICEEEINAEESDGDGDSSYAT